MRVTASTSVLAAASVLGLLWLALPVRLPATAAEASTAECLTLADTPSTDVAALERCHTIVPNDVELAADLGAAYEAAGRVAEAIETYRRIVALDPTYADIHVRLARLLHAHGETGAAKAHVEQALRIQPNRTTVIDYQAELAR